MKHLTIVNGSLSAIFRMNLCVDVLGLCSLALSRSYLAQRSSIGIVCLFASLLLMTVTHTRERAWMCVCVCARTQFSHSLARLHYLRASLRASIDKFCSLLFRKLNKTDCVHTQRIRKKKKKQQKRRRKKFHGADKRKFTRTSVIQSR